MFGLPKNSQRKSGMLVAWNALCFIFLPVTCKLSECDLVLWVICLQIYRSLRGRVLWYPAIRRLPQWLATELAIVSVVSYTIHGITHRFWDLWVLRASGSSLALSIPNKRTTHERSGCLINLGSVWVRIAKDRQFILRNLCEITSRMMRALPMCWTFWKDGIAWQTRCQGVTV